MPKANSKIKQPAKPAGLRHNLASYLAPQQRNLPWLLLALIIMGLDLTSKAWVSSNLVLYQKITLLPVFDLTLIHNSGAAFSFLASSGGWQRWFFIGVALGASLLIWVWLNRLKPSEKLVALSLVLILGGAWGNLYDRVVHGYVVDFLAWHWHGHYFPAFNLADTAITLGAAGLIWDALLGSKASANKSTN